MTSRIDASSGNGRSAIRDPATALAGSIRNESSSLRSGRLAWISRSAGGAGFASVPTPRRFATQGTVQPGDHRVDDHDEEDEIEDLATGRHSFQYREGRENDGDRSAQPDPANRG